MYRIHILNHLAGAVGGGVEGGITRTCLNRVAAREFGQGASDSLLNDGSNLASVGSGSRLEGEEAACFGDTLASLIVGVVALVDSVLKSVGVPSILEVSVPGVSSGVTSGIDEGPLIGTRGPA